jgi:alpha-tubulin suppressor-like RCC1 family protein
MVNGSVRCWGGNYDGQLGDGTTMNHADASSAPEVLTGVSLLAAGGADHNCALLTTGRLRCWGSNNYGQLGVEDRSAHPTPTDVREVCP